MTLHVICVAYQRVIPLRILIDSFLVQTVPNWVLHIVHDGPAPQSVWEVINSYSDPRIRFWCTSVRYGNFGHVNRRNTLQSLTGDLTNDYVLLTNDDNYYVPVFVNHFLKECKSNVGMVYCDTVHSYMGYSVLHSRVKEGFIDCGSFITRLDVAQSVGFRHDHHSADGTFAEECARYCVSHNLVVRYIPRPLFVHN